MRKRVKKNHYSEWMAAFLFLWMLAVICYFFWDSQALAASSVADGTYEIDGVLRHASADQNSMGNAAISKPLTLVVKDGEATLQMELVPLTAKLGTAKLTGYLSDFYYFPDWEGGDTGYDMPDDEEAYEVTVDSYYEDTYDSYNDPKKGTDANVKGKLYPHEVSMPVTLQDEEIWVQVYVPVMESISAGSGLQYAKLQLDWSSLNQIADSTEDTGDTGSTDTQTSSTQDTGAETDKSALQTMLLSAASLSGRDTVYTKDSLQALKTAIKAAQKIYKKESATQKEIDKQTEALSEAIINLEEKESSSNSNNSEDNLDVENLEDGIYSVEGTMVKTDKSTLSMSNDAINHTVKITVKNGDYKVTLDFKGLKINSQYGYLSRLKYYTSGYTLDQYGKPSGTKKGVTVDSYQTDSSGSRVEDDFGTDYPDEVTFPLIEEALEDGYVPLEVFVPIMEAISAGTGTQAVYLKLDLDTVKQAESSDFEEEDEEDDTGVSAASATTAAVSTTASKSSTLSSAKVSATTAKSSSTKSTTASKKSTKSGSDLTSGQDSATTEAAEETTESGTADTTSVSGESDEDTAASRIPLVSSLVILLAGIAYKMKSRRISFREDKP